MTRRPTIPTGLTHSGMPLDVLIESNCLMPDGCPRWDAPVMREPLLPLARFDRPDLRETPAWATGADALFSVDLFLAKRCAGLDLGMRASGAEVRAALRAGAFDARCRATLEWTLSSCPRTEFPDLLGRGGIAIYDMARCFWTAFDGHAFSFAAWLNQWGRDAARPPPGQDYEYRNFPLTRSWVAAGRPPVWPPPAETPPSD